MAEFVSNSAIFPSIRPSAVLRAAAWDFARARKMAEFGINSAMIVGWPSVELNGHRNAQIKHVRPANWTTRNTIPVRTPMSSDNEKTCFFIAPIGEASTQTREDSDRVLRRIVRAAVHPLGFNAIRADDISAPGIITSQVLEMVVESPLVIADLTGHNPNVFYELAIRHAIRKPFVQMIRKNETIPFDVATARTVRYDFDVDSAQDAIEDITRQIQSLESDPTDIETPISMSLDLQSLRTVTDQSSNGLHQVLPLLEDINSAVHNNSNEISRLRDMGAHAQGPTGQSWNPAIHRLVLKNQNSYGFIASIGSMRPAYPWIYELGSAAYTRVIMGDADTGTEMFRQMKSLIQSRFAAETNFVTTIAPELQVLFDRMVAATTSGHGESYGGYGGSYRADDDDLPVNFHRL